MFTQTNWKVLACILAPTLLLFSLILFLALGHLTVQVPRFQQNWRPDTEIEILVCPGTSEEIVSQSMNTLTGLVDQEVKSWSISPIDYCFCQAGLIPMRNTIEVYQSEPQQHGTKLGAGATKRFWKSNGEMTSACVMIPLSTEDRFDVQSVVTHELIHAFGSSHAFMFGRYWPVDQEGRPDPSGSDYDGWGDPLHLMYKSICTTCSSLRGVGSN